MNTDTNQNKVTPIEMVISLAAAFILTQVTWISVEKRALMLCVYVFLALLQIGLFIADINKGKKNTLKNVAAGFIVSLTVLYTFLAFLRNDWEKVKDGIGATFVVLGTPHPYMLGWWLVKQFFQSLVH